MYGLNFHIISPLEKYLELSVEPLDDLFAWRLHSLLKRKSSNRRLALQFKESIRGCDVVKFRNACRIFTTSQVFIGSFLLYF